MLDIIYNSFMKETHEINKSEGCLFLSHLIKNQHVWVLNIIFILIYEIDTSFDQLKSRWYSQVNYFYFILFFCFCFLSSHVFVITLYDWMDILWRDGRDGGLV